MTVFASNKEKLASTNIINTAPDCGDATPLALPLMNQRIDDVFLLMSLDVSESEAIGSKINVQNLLDSLMRCSKTAFWMSKCPYFRRIC